MTGGCDVCLVAMPLQPLPLPAYGLGLLHAVLNRGGIATRSHYANLRYADRIGLDRFAVAFQTRTEDLAFEWIFAGAAFGDAAAPGAGDAYLDRLYARTLPLRRLDRAAVGELFHGLRRDAAAFVDETAGRILEMRPRIVGCASTFQQHVASLAVLRRVRALAPGVVTMMGGANCETRMGRATHRHFPWVDVVVSGEADGLIVPLCRRLLDQGADLDPAGLDPAVFVPAHRRGGYPAAADGDGVPRATTRSLAGLPAPDYDDYFAELDRCGLKDHILPTLSFESSRGCWWGQRRHCTFCGLNGTAMGYRTKDPGQVRAEIDHLHGRYGIRHLHAVDNILPVTYFDSLLPALAERDRGLGLFYEAKANLNERQMEILRRAGVTFIQAGIESMIQGVLDLMAKGTAVARNVLALRLARQFGVRVLWTTIVGTPGEDDRWYAEAAAWLPLISHLQPGGLTLLRFDRYSLYQSEPDRFGLDLVPSELYGHVYPVAGADLAELAYFFEGRGQPAPVRNLLDHPLPDRPGAEAVRRVLATWTRLWEGAPPTLHYRDTGDALEITDTRPVAGDAAWEATGLDRALLLAASMPATPARLAGLLGLDPADPALDRAIAGLRERGLLLRVPAGLLLSLVVKGDVPDLPPAYDSPLGLLMATASPGRRRALSSHGAEPP